MNNSNKIKKSCIHCNNTFFVYPSNSEKKFCSKECYHSHPKPKGKNSKKFSKVKVKCDFCNKGFYKHPSAIKRTKHNLCSTECRQHFLAENRKNKTNKKVAYCHTCNKEIIRTEAEFKNRPAKNYFCSTECKDEHLRKGRGGFTHKIKKCEYCNKEFTITSRNRRKVKYCSNECKKNGFPKGEKHLSFKKELSRDYRSKHRLTHENTTWRQEVFKRDNFTCVVCSKHGDKLNAHHLENYASCKEKRFDIDNGVTLCILCHKNFHSKYGVVRNTPVQFNEFKNSYKIQC